LLYDPLFLFNLHGSHPTDGLFSLNSFLLACLKDLFVFDAQFAALDIETIQSDHDCIRISRLAEIGECQTTERSLLIKVVVERIGRRDRQ